MACQPKPFGLESAPGHLAPITLNHVVEVDVFQAHFPIAMPWPSVYGALVEHFVCLRWELFILAKEESFGRGVRSSDSGLCDSE